MAEFTRFHWVVAVSLDARRPMCPREVLADAHSCTRAVTSALIQPSGAEVHAELPLVSVEVAFSAVQAGCAFHREEVVAAPVDHTSHGYALQSVLPEWKFHRDSLAPVTSASAIGAVFHEMKERAVRGVPSAFFVPGSPRSSSTSVDQSRVSPCWT
ncbi:hypothetical protein SALBM217S_04847 [Streptomyces griseoloalbus]